MQNRIDEINTSHHFESGVYAREMDLPKGWSAETHKHKFSHMSILAKGEADVTVDGETTRYKAPVVVNIGAGKTHSIVAIVDSTWFCIHPTETVEQDGSYEPILIEEA